MPTISIILPAFNSRALLHEAVRSVCAQTLAGWELIVVDDGSSDGTGAAADAMAAADGRIRSLHQSNMGPGVARNAGIASARGKYLAFLDADDALASPDALAAAVAKAEATQAECLVCGADGIHAVTQSRHPLAWCLRTDLLPKQEVFSGKDAGIGLFFIAGAVPWAKLYRRDFIVRHGLAFPPLGRSEDFPFVQLSLALAERIATLQMPLVLHRMGVPGSLEATKDENPCVFADAEDFFFSELRKRGLEREFADAAAARAMSRLLYNLNEVRTFDGKRKVFERARKERPEFRLEGTAASFRDYALARKGVDGILSHGSAEEWIHAASPALERSFAYRAGMVAAWPARKARGGVKCLLENGFLYTVKHAAGKILRLFGAKPKW